MMVCAQLVRHGMAHAQEGVGKGHACHCGSVCHLLSGLRIVRSVVIAAGQIFKDIFNRLQRHTVGKIRSHDGYISLQGMGQRVDTGSAGQALGLGHHIIRIYDCHIRHQLIVCDGPLGSSLSVRNNRKGRHFRACTGGCGNRYKHGLFSHLREHVNSFADIHKVHGQILKSALWMLVHKPHDFSGVHRGTAAQSNDHIRLERLDLFYAFLRALQRRIGSHLIEAGVGNAHLIQLVGNRFRVSAAVKETVRYDKGFLLMIIGLQLIQSHRQAAFLKVYLLRRSEPEHVLSPFRNGLNIEQMFYVYIFGYGVAAVGTAAQRQGGRQFEIVQVTDSALGGRRIHQNTAGLHSGRVLRHLLRLRGMDVERGSMAVAAVLNQPFGHFKSRLKIFRLIKGQHRRKLLMGEGFGTIYGSHLANQNLGILRHFKACDLCDFVCRLADNLRVHRPCLCQNDRAHLRHLFFVQDMASALYELCAHLIINIFYRCHRLLRSANHTIVKGLGMNYGIHGQLNIAAAVHDDRRISRAYANGRFSGGISCLHHARASGSQNHIRRTHQLIGQLQSRIFNTVNQTLGRSCRLRRLAHNAGRFRRAFFRPWMGADEDRVSRLQADQAFENRRRGRIRGRNNCSHQAHRLRNLLNAIGSVLFNHAAGFHILIGVVNVLGCIVIFDNLVFHNAHASLFHRHLCKRNTLLIGRHSCLEKDFIYLLLCKCSKSFLRLPHPGNLLLQLFHIRHLFRFLRNRNCMHLLCLHLLFLSAHTNPP